MDPADRGRVPEDPWLDFLEGNNPGLARPGPGRQGWRSSGTGWREFRADISTPDTRLCDDMNNVNPAQTDVLTQSRAGRPGARALWLPAARPRTLLRPGAAAPRTAGGCRGARRDPLGRRGDRLACEPRPGARAHGHRPGRRVRGAPGDRRNRRRTDDPRQPLVILRPSRPRLRRPARR